MRWWNVSCALIKNADAVEAIVISLARDSFKKPVQTDKNTQEKRDHVAGKAGVCYNR